VSPLSNLDGIWSYMPVSMGICLVGNAAWFAAYLLAIVVGFREKTYAVPLVAVAMNLSWELIFGFLLPPPVPALRYSFIAGCLPDVVIAYQVLRYGARMQTTPALRRRFNVVAPLAFPAAFFLVYGFVVLTSDALGMLSALLINVMMSALFIDMFFRRPEGRGLSYAVAWCKGLGTLLNLPALYYLFAYAHAGVRSGPFVVACGVIVTALDATYIYLLCARRRAVPQNVAWTVTGPASAG